jgi:malonate decarboxylase beta subunit
MENLSYRHNAQQRAAGSKSMAIIGVVASGNLEVLVERALPDAECQVDISTTAEGFGAVWEAVVADFVERRSPGGLKLSINDGGARPDTVALRLAQAVRSIEEDAMSTLQSETEDKPRTARAKAPSWYEASARQRVRSLLDAGSLKEFIGPEQREVSPHLGLFDLPEQFDDGMIVGRGRIYGEPVFIAAQEGWFMGGSFGEIHGAKLTGLLRAARDAKSIPVLILFDTGGVRLQEANAGELAIAEIMRALIEARMTGVKVVGLIGGRAGCYGGGGLIAGCCSALAASQQGRISVSGPEVIETNRGVEEFDSKDRALVWRTMGGENRRLIGGAEAFVDDTIQSFRDAALHLIKSAPAFGADVLKAEQARLKERLEHFGSCADALDIWRAQGIDDAEAVPATPAEEFIALADKVRRPRYDAR